jgi:hypothetical protein
MANCESQLQRRALSNKKTCRNVHRTGRPDNLQKFSFSQRLKERPIAGRTGVAGSTSPKVGLAQEEDNDKEEDEEEEEEEEEEEFPSDLTNSNHCNGPYDSPIHPQTVTSHNKDQLFSM